MQGARIASVNVGLPREIRVGPRIVRTSIWKDPVVGPVAIRGVNLAGDDQSDPRVHGGERKAVYAYAREDLDVTGARVGERWRVGTALLEVTRPRLPCFKLEARMDRPGFIAEFVDGGRPGAYLRIVEEGEVRAGDAVELVSRPDGAPSMADVMRMRTPQSE